MKRLSAAVLLVWALSGAGTCRAYSGAEPFDFLFLDANARAVAMGGAYTAMAGDANALLYNPAGLVKAGRHEATFMHNQYFEGISQEYLAYASPSGWGANLNYLKFGNVQRTSISNPDGRDLGTEGLTDMALAGGYGLALGPDFALGAGLKYIHESIASVSGSAWACDLGVLGSVPRLRGLTYGMALQNLGPTVRFQKEDESLPMNFRAGAAYGFEVGGQQSTFSLDVTKERSEKALVGVGAETVIAKTVPVRIGFSSRNQAGPGITGGVGWLYHDLAFDYAFVPFGDLGSAHRISVSWGWGGTPKTRVGTARRLLEDLPAPKPAGRPQARPASRPPARKPPKQAPPKSDGQDLGTF